MDRDKISIRLSFGTTLLAFLVLLVLFQWDKNINTIRTYDLFLISFYSFLIGLGVAFIIRLVGAKTDYNLGSILILAFFGIIYFVVGDIEFGTILILDFVLYFCIALLIALALGFFRLIL
jgi:hypothetical protein